MNACSRRYDPELQMFVDTPREPDLAHLRFIRWLAEHGHMEHEVLGAPVGEYAIEELDEHPAAV
jgi:hypothetical protein